MPPAKVDHDRPSGHHYPFKGDYAMGWKRVKEHYRIDHIVKMVDGVMHIGSSYVGALVTVTPEGRAETDRTFSSSADLRRYRDEINSDPDLYRRLMAEADTFAASIPVYTWRDGEILERFCEEFGWPKVTHDGTLMYDNTFFLDRREALKEARRDAGAAVEGARRRIAEARDELVRRETMLDEALRIQAAYDDMLVAART